MLRLRPYNSADADAILSRTREEKAFYQRTAGAMGVFENSPAACYCYRAAGFRDAVPDGPEAYHISGEERKRRELAAAGTRAPEFTNCSN